MVPNCTTHHICFPDVLSRHDISPKSLLEKCPYSELFWSVFSSIWTEYGEIRSIQSKCGKIRTSITPNTDTFYAVNNAMKKRCELKNEDKNIRAMLNTPQPWWSYNQVNPSTQFIRSFKVDWNFMPSYLKRYILIFYFVSCIKNRDFTMLFMQL